MIVDWIRQQILSAVAGWLRDNPGASFARYLFLPPEVIGANGGEAVSIEVVIRVWRKVANDKPGEDIAGVHYVEDVAEIGQMA